GDGKIGRVKDGARVREHLVAGDPAVTRAVCAGSRVAGGGDRRKAEARQNARRSRVPGVGDEERARPLMERAERIAFVELSDGHKRIVPFCGSGFAFATHLTAPRRVSFGSNSFPPASAASPTPPSAGPPAGREHSPSCGLAVVVAAFVKPADASPLGGDEAVQGLLHSDGRHLGLTLDLSVAPVLKM